MAWTKQYTETDAQSASTDDTPLSVASINFTPTAGYYLIIGTLEMQTDDLTEGEAYVDLVKDGSTAYAENAILPQELTAWEPAMVSWFGYLPNANQTWELYIAHSSPFAGVIARMRKLVIIRIDDQTFAKDLEQNFRNKLDEHSSAEDNSNSATTNSAYQTKLTHSPTIPTTGYYMAFASAEVQGDTAAHITGVKLDYNSDAIIAENLITSQEVTAWEPVFLSLGPVYLTAGSQTFRLQYKSDGTNNSDIINARIVLVPLTGLGEVEVKSNTAGLATLEAVKRHVTAGQADLESPPHFSTTAGRAQLDYATDKTSLVSPADTSTQQSPVTFVWTIPQNDNNDVLHAQIQIDNDSGFGSPEFDLISALDSGFEFWDGDSWEPWPGLGLSSAYYGNQGRIAITFATPGLRYWRVRHGA